MSVKCPLRAQEIDIVKLMADGDSHKVTARKLGITQGMINMRLQGARRVVDVRNTTHLVAKAIREGWIK